MDRGSRHAAGLRTCARSFARSFARSVCGTCGRRARAARQSASGTLTMLGRIIEWSARNIFLVLLSTVFVVGAGVYAVLHTPLDALPDLSDVQVIVYTE